MNKIYVLILLSIITLSACKQETPNCSSDDAKKFVFDIVKEELSNPSKSYWARVSDKITLKLNDIRTTKHDKELDTYLCVANLEGKLSEQDIQSTLSDIIKEYQSEYEKTELMLKDGYNEFSAKIDEKEKNKLSELEKEYSRNLEKKLLENENHYERMSSQIEVDAKNYKRAGATDKEVSESLERNKIELSSNYNRHKERFIQERDDSVKRIEENLKTLEESYPDDISKIQVYFKQEKERYLSEAKDKLDRMLKEHEQAVESYRSLYSNGIKSPVRYKIESSDDGKDFYVTVQ